MQETKLTQEQITSMSEVVAKYMGWGKFVRDEEFYFLMGNGEAFWYQCIDAIDWNIIHEVWEKLKIDENFKNTILYDPIVTLLAFGTKEQAFTAIYNAIKFIQDEKQ